MIVFHYVSLRRKTATIMSSTKSKETAVKQLRVIVEPRLSLAIQRANELGVTGEEYKDLKRTDTDFVIVYYR